jgi:hypothetical protein
VKYFNIEAEVAGGLGPHSIAREVPGQLLVEKLHYVFEGWQGDELLESAPCYIVTQQLADRLRAGGMRGVSFDQVEISRSEIFDELHPNETLPPFVWMKITGTKGKDDFFFAAYARLVVSQRVWQIITPYAAHAVVSEFTE